jgi:8-oxo-dGTP diphosphatase
MLPHWYIVNVEAAIVKDGRYLMIVRSDQETHAAGMLSMPGGKVERAGVAGNILEATLRREIREEVGVEVEDEMAYVESKSFISDNGQAVVDIVFLCRYLSGTPAILEPDEVADIRWMSAEEVHTHPKAPPWTRSSIELAERMRLARRW